MKAVRGGDGRVYICKDKFDPIIGRMVWIGYQDESIIIALNRLFDEESRGYTDEQFWQEG